MLNFIIKHRSIIAIIVLLLALAGISVSYKNVVASLEQREAYISAVENNANGKYVELEMTKAQLRNSKDSVNMLLDSLIQAKKLTKTITRVERVVSEFHRTDSLYILDTIFVKGTKFDTTIRDDLGFYRCQLSGKFPNQITVTPVVTSDLILYTHMQKEYVNPRSKIFFVRWFQKKRKIFVTDVEDRNPYVEIKSSRIVQVADD